MIGTWPGIVGLAGVLLMACGYVLAARALLRLPDGRSLVKRLMLGHRWPEGAPMSAAGLVVLGLACLAVGITCYAFFYAPSPPAVSPAPEQNESVPVHRSPVAN